MTKPYKDLDLRILDECQKKIDAVLHRHDELIAEFEARTGVPYRDALQLKKGSFHLCEKCGDKTKEYLPIVGRYGYSIAGEYKCKVCGYKEPG